jgi:galactokinase
MHRVSPEPRRIISTLPADPDRFDDEAALTQRLLSAGMAVEAAASRAALFKRCDLAMRQEMGGGPSSLRSRTFGLFVPGRIEVLGKHTDYAGGRSLLCAIERGMCLLVSPRSDQTLRFLALNRSEKAEFEISPDLKPPTGHWSNYPMTVARRVARNFAGKLHGADIVMLSDLPQAAGLSSSSALIVGTFMALSRINDLRDRSAYRVAIGSETELASYLGTVENGRGFGTLAGDRGVGTFGGSEDHTAILLCKAGQLSLYSFCPARAEGAVPLPGDYCFVVANSGVVAEKTRGAMEAYNAISRRVALLLEIWNVHTGRRDACLADVVRSSRGATRALRALANGASPGATDPLLPGRLEQFVLESEELVPDAFAALSVGDLPRFGRVVAASQSASENLLHNQTPQTVTLARAALECGATAASCFGAGFGGGAWALVPRTGAQAFADRWLTAYRREAQGYADDAVGAFITGAGTAATWV